MSSSKDTSQLKKIRGLGAANSGTDAWWVQRKTAIILIPLVMWFILVINDFLFNPEIIISLILYSPLRFLCFLILVNVAIYHGMLGIQEICEDYIRHEIYKFTTIFLIQCLSWLTMIAMTLMLLINFIINI